MYAEQYNEVYNMARKRVEISGIDLDAISGGATPFTPGNKTLRSMGLDSCVRCTGGLAGMRYDVNIDGEWKDVSSGEMLAFVGRTLGEDSGEFKALYGYMMDVRV